MEQLLTTKLYLPPIKAGLVSRPHLYDFFQEGANPKLTLVSAPAGFGKSTLVAGWLAESGAHAAWLSLDPGDNDPVRFWTYLIAAIQTVHKDVGEEARQFINTPQLRNPEPMAISLINDISLLTQELVLVLDDYHLIEAGPIHTGLNYLLQHQPQNLHIVLITRVDPALSLARLRAHGRLVEIRAGDLQFSPDEAAVLFNEVESLNLKPGQIEALNHRAEGWIVGLNLAALSLKGRAVTDTIIERFTGSHQFILDYLAEEVLGSLPEKHRHFLLRTAILDRFSPALCDAITGNQDSLQVLEDLRAGSLFLIPLDADGKWFRYHHLFTEVLNVLLLRDLPGEVDTLHLKAAEWFEREGHPDQAVDHGLRSGDMARARELVLKYWSPFLQRGEVATVLRWLDALPEDKYASDPSVPLARCWALFLSWRNSAIGPHLEQANNAYKLLMGKGSLNRNEQGLIAAQLAMMRSVLARGRGEHARSVAHAEEAAGIVRQEKLEGMGTAWNMLAAARAGAGDYEGAIEAYGQGIALAHDEGNLVGAYGCTYGQAMYMLLQGQINEAEELCLSTIDRAVNDGRGDFPAAGWLHIAMARIHLERYDLDKAEAYLGDGLRITRPGGFGEAERSGRYLQAHLEAARGNLDAAAVIFQDTERIIHAMDDPFLTGELNREWAALCLKTKELEAARERLHILDEKIAATQHDLLLIGWRWLSPRMLCAEKRYEEAFTTLEAFIQQARNADSQGELVRLLALQAVALEGLGKPTPARSVLREVLRIGATGGYIWRWLNAGPQIWPLLQELKTDQGTPQEFLPYLDTVLDACRADFGTFPHHKERRPDPLTTREVEIMRLIANGYSNPEIAGTLVVSLNTIKKHTSNIYGKLGVRSRTQAIARARELDLI